MAKLKVFAVYDSKLEAYARPFFMQTQGQALRGFMDVVNDPQTEISKHPEDFTLFYLADYNEDSGKFENHPAPQALGVALEYHQGKKTYDKVTELHK